MHKQERNTGETEIIPWTRIILKIYARASFIESTTMSVSKNES